MNPTQVAEKHPTGPVHQGLVVRGIEFDFARKLTAPIAVEHIPATIDAGRFVWIDIDYRDRESARGLVSGTSYIPDQILEDVLQDEDGILIARHDDYLHLLMSGCRIDERGTLVLEPLDVVVTERFLLTLHQGPRPLLDMVHRDYQRDFLRYAQSPSFLVYELWDSLIEHYVATQKRLERIVDGLQRDLMRDIDDTVFSRIAEIGEHLLHFRALLLPARSVLSELATRRSIFVSEPTQAALANMVGTVERVLQDVLVDRDILAQSLSLHMSMLSHRTNRAMNRLTVISTIFLPLTFLCGLYGMNFRYMPELHWHYGYPMFWLVAGTMVAAQIVIMRKARLL